MSIQFGLMVMIVLIVVVMIDGIPILEALTEDECKSYFVSNDINLRLHAIFVCPRKWRPKIKKHESTLTKRSTPKAEEDITEDDLDDFYLFW